MKIWSFGLPLAISAAVVSALCCVMDPARGAQTTDIVLVHGAWVDASGWKPVYELLRKDGYDVSMVQEPLTTLDDDVTATRRIIDMQPGRVVLVGHSYAGSIITEAGNDPKVVALVYICAHAPDNGETQAENDKRFPSVLSKSSAIETTANGFTFVDPKKFPALFAGDVPLDQAEFEANSQVFAAAQLFKTPIVNPAWRTKPSWTLIATGDQIISPDLERFYAARAHSRVVTIQGSSHSVYMTHPKEVTALIEAAADGVGTGSVP
jgi:pimeloyl-ACP methyl ester carboxylesterase